MSIRLTPIALTLGLVGLCLAISPIGISKADQHSQTFTDEQKSEINKIIRDYLIKNPEVVRDALVELEKRQVAQQEEKQKSGIAKNAEAIFRGKDPLIAGNPNGDVTVVEFFDYNCGYCRRATAHILKLIENDKNVRVVFKELPIFGEQSEAAAKAAIAAQKQNKYFELHSALMLEPGRSDKSKAIRLAKKLGLDLSQLEADMKQPFVNEAIASTQKLANILGIQGTPFYLVGDRIIPGAPEDLYDQLLANVAEIRKNGCSVQC